jgi:hypothetical protein
MPYQHSFLAGVAPTMNLILLLRKILHSQGLFPLEGGIGFAQKVHIPPETVIATGASRLHRDAVVEKPLYSQYRCAQGTSLLTT